MKNENQPNSPWVDNTVYDILNKVRLTEYARDTLEEIISCFDFDFCLTVSEKNELVRQIKWFYASENEEPLKRPSRKYEWSLQTTRTPLFARGRAKILPIHISIKRLVRIIFVDAVVFWVFDLLTKGYPDRNEALVAAVRASIKCVPKLIGCITLLDGNTHCVYLNIDSAFHGEQFSINDFTEHMSSTYNRLCYRKNPLLRCNHKDPDTSKCLLNSEKARPILDALVKKDVVNVKNQVYTLN